MFCGIGPFAIKAAKKLNCIVLANDLNPKCYEYLNKNIKKNKVTKNVYGFNCDARAFIKHLASKASIN